MLSFYQLLEKAVLETDRHVTLWGLPTPGDMYTPEIEAQATALLETAARETTDKAALARIADEQKMWDGARKVLAVNAERRRQIETGEPELKGLILHHDYWKGSGKDLAGGGRDAILGAGATQHRRYVELNGRADSRVMIPTRGADGKTLEQLIEEAGGEATIVIWFEGDGLLDDKDRRYILFDGRGRTPDTSRVAGLTFWLDMARRLPAVTYAPRPAEQYPAQSRRLSIDDADAQKQGQVGGMLNINRLQQYILVVKPPGPEGQSNVHIHVNGRGSFVSKGVLKENPFALLGADGLFALGGKKEDQFSHESPRGKLYRLLIYNRAIPNYDDNYQSGFFAITKALEVQSGLEDDPTEQDAQKQLEDAAGK
jgi:hypothetical protein